MVFCDRRIGLGFTPVGVFAGGAPGGAAKGIGEILGGRIAEEIIFGDITTGASSDIKKATKVARAMVTRFGMSENIGVICYDNDDDEVFIGRDLAHTKSYSEAVTAQIDQEVKQIIDDCYNKAKQMILNYEHVLHRCAELLLEKEKITGVEFEKLFTNPEKGQYL